MYAMAFLSPDTVVFLFIRLQSLQTLTFLWYLMMIWCANFLLAFGPVIACIISLREIRMLFNETKSG